MIVICLITGSSVVTSLCGGEADKKHVVVLEVNHLQQFKTTGIPLKTVRPFVFQVRPDLLE